MVKVLVTGACGGLGPAVIDELLAHGYEVSAADRVRKPVARAHVVETDLTDVGQAAYAARGCDAVIHLGAIPSPYSHADEVVFRNNTGATFAVLQAASLLGIRAAVIASSGSAYGNAWAPQAFPPAYLPIDEDHPMRNHDAYGLSKEVDEVTARMFARRDGMAIAALRFHWIATKEQALARDGNDAPDGREGVRTVWGYVERGDAARACRLAAEAALRGDFGFEAFNIVAKDTLANEETEPLMRRLAPETELRAPLPGFTGGFDISKAKRLLGWEPLWSWRENGND